MQARAPDAPPALRLTSRAEVRLLEWIEVVHLPLPELPGPVRDMTWRRSVGDLYRRTAEEPGDLDAWAELVRKLATGRLFKDASEALERAAAGPVEESALAARVAEALAGEPHLVVALAMAWREAGGYEGSLELVRRYGERTESEPVRDRLAEVARVSERYLARREVAEAALPAAPRLPRVPVRAVVIVLLPLALLLSMRGCWDRELDRRLDQGRRNLDFARRARDDGVRRASLQDAYRDLEFYAGQRNRDLDSQRLLGEAGYRLGVEHQAVHYLQTAEAALRRVLREVPDDGPSRLLLGRVLRELGRAPEAREELRRAAGSDDDAAAGEAIVELRRMGEGP